ncbi:hypothetical protein SEA_FRANCOB_236 [Streptomyces phage Francob]
MPKVRAKNDRSGIMDLGAHHSYKAPNIPNPRVTSEDFCRGYHNLKVSLQHNKISVAKAAKKAVSRQSAENLQKLTDAKTKVAETKEMIFTHLMECDSCK